MDGEVLSVERTKAVGTLEEIDSLILNTERFANKSVARMSRLLLEVKQGAYWTERGFLSEDDYIKTLPYSRAQYYNLIGIAQNLGSLSEEEIADIGTKKAQALVRIAKHDQSLLEEWYNRAKEVKQMDFLEEVQDFFGKKDKANDEDIEWVRVKASKEQSNVINEAFKIAGMMLGSDKSKAHQLEVICAEFLSANNDDGGARLGNRNGYIISIIKNLAHQLDEDALSALVNALAGIVEGVNHG